MHTIKIHYINEDKHPRTKCFYSVKDIYISIYLDNILILLSDHAIIVELENVSAIEIDGKLHEL